MLAVCFLHILLYFVSELLSVFSDGHDDLRHRIQHQTVHNDLMMKYKSFYHIQIPQC